MEGELVAPASEIAHWKEQIVEAWQTSVAHVIKTGLLIEQAKQSLGVSYRELEAVLPFTATVATYLIKIAQNAVLSNPTYQKSLPNSYSTLYQLTLVNEDLLIKEINSGTITPSLRLDDAKKLKTPRRSPKQSTTGKTKTTNPQFHFGTISISKMDHYMEFRAELLELLKKHEGKVQYTLKKDSVGEWHLARIAEQASSEIKKIEQALQGESFVAVEKLLDLKLFLHKNKHALEKRKVHFGGGERLLACLGSDHPEYKSVANMLGSKDITIRHLNQYWQDNQLSRIQDEKSRNERYLKIWGLVLEFCVAKGDKTIIKKLLKIQQSFREPHKQDWINEILSELTAFSN